MVLAEDAAGLLSSRCLICDHVLCHASRSHMVMLSAAARPDVHVSDMHSNAGTFASPAAPSSCWSSFRIATAAVPWRGRDDSWTRRRRQKACNGVKTASMIAFNDGFTVGDTTLTMKPNSQGCLLPSFCCWEFGHWHKHGIATLSCRSDARPNPSSDMSQMQPAMTGQLGDSQLCSNGGQRCESLSAQLQMCEVAAGKSPEHWFMA